ncbi:hypothetical protein [Rheinheimera sp. KL1]|nr:hypothetical protein [Rheinheimera sp. KL1]
MTSIIYEHPLNEKVRTYLRVEYLFQQVTNCCHSKLNGSSKGFLTHYFR